MHPGKGGAILSCSGPGERFAGKAPGGNTVSIPYIMGQYVSILYGLVGLIILVVVALRPKLFWSLLIIITVGTVGLMVPQYNLCLVDEFLIACLLFGSLLAILMGAIRFRRRQEDVWDQLHRRIFLLFIGYMIIQSFRGMLLWDDLRVSRWIVYYLMLGMLAFIISRSDLPAPKTKEMSLVILSSALVYFIAYLTHGLYNQIVRGLSYARLDIQGVEWAGPAYAVFSLVIAVPATIFLLKEYGSRKQRWMGWAMIIIALIVGAFYDCRSAWIVVLAFLIVSLFVLRLRQITAWLLITMCLTMFFYTSSTWFIQMLAKTAVFQDPGEVGRLLYTQIAFRTIIAHAKTLFFGYGIHSHHFVMAPDLHAYGYSVGMSYVRVSGLAGLLVDIGLLGILLLGMNYLLVARKILAGGKRSAQLVLLPALAFTFMWPAVNKIEDIVLFYLLIMPSGLLIQLSKIPRRGSLSGRLSSAGRGRES